MTDSYIGSKVQIVLPPIPNPPGGHYLTDEENAGTRQRLFFALDQQTARIQSRLDTRPGDPIAYVAVVLSGIYQGTQWVVLPDWLFPLEIPCNCSTQTLLLRGCQNMLHI